MSPSPVLLSEYSLAPTRFSGSTPHINTALKTARHHDTRPSTSPRLPPGPCITVSPLRISLVPSCCPRHFTFHAISVITVLLSSRPVPTVLPSLASAALQVSTDICLSMKARLALRTNETPVGCVLVHNGRVIAKGMNATNVTRNGTRHAELMALSALLSYTPQADMEQPAAQCREILEESWGDVDPEDGHLFPYGQKLHPAPRVDKTIVKDCILYVTVEPCVMCASMLRQFGIKKVYFGAVNDKFGGTGGVFFIHVNSDSVSAPPSPTLRPAKGRILRPMLHRKPLSCTEALISPENSGNGSGKSIASTTEGNSNTETEDDETNELSEPFRRGDGGNVEAGYEVEGGWGRDEAVTLLRQFYVQENGRGKEPRCSSLTLSPQIRAAFPTLAVTS